MVLAVATALLLTQTPSAQETLAKVRDHYQSLNSFSAIIDHHESSGLFPGDYTQELRWKKGDKFELKVTKPSSKEGSKAPNYFSNGKEVQYIGNGQNSSRPVAPDGNTMPGWEVSGGPALAWLMKTPSGNFFFKPPEGFKAETSFGSRESWKDEKVKEILFGISRGEETVKVSFFVTPEAKHLVGFEWSQRDGKKGWMHYKNRKDNPELPDKLGEHVQK